jgi:hypothetical protein
LVLPQVFQKTRIFNKIRVFWCFLSGCCSETEVSEQLLYMFGSRFRGNCKSRQTTRPPQRLGHFAARPSFAGEHSRFDITAQAVSLLRYSLSALAALPTEAMSAYMPPQSPYPGRQTFLIAA